MSAADESQIPARDTAQAPGGVSTAGTPAQQPLFPAPAEAPARPAALVRPMPGRRRLWLCLRLPMLPLEAAGAVDGRPGVVVEDQRGIRRVLQANAAARSKGIGAGQSVNAAMSLAPDLDIRERDPSAERQALERLAAWAERYTSFVSLEPPDCLLLELAGSLRLFAGYESLRARIAEGLQALGHEARLAAAPTPLAATWLARAGGETGSDEAASPAGRLGALPLDCLDWPEGVLRSLRGMGVVSVGDCLRLPRAGFAKRFGARRLEALDRALGRLPDPRDHYRTPPRFCGAVDLDGEQSDSALLLNVCERLLEDLDRFLLSRQLEVQRLRFRFFHLDAPATSLVVGSGRATAGVGHWLELLGLRFERITLRSPVIAVELRSAPGRSLSVTTGSLLGERAGHRDVAIERLVERLGARIGDAAIHGVTTVADHRPQYAWRPTGVNDEPPRCANAAGRWQVAAMPPVPDSVRRTNGLLLRRPLWMLDEPERLGSADGRPVYRDGLDVVAGPERLESGWWDGEGIARDYYVARTGRGVLLWIYEDRRRRGDWYLHGVFG